MSRFPHIVLAIVTFLLAGCGTVSHLRPADTLRQYETDVQVGLAGNSVPHFLPSVRVDVGLTDNVEGGVLWELTTVLAELRLGLLKTEHQGIAFALGFPFGYVYQGGRGMPTAGVSATLGRRFDHLDFYLGSKILPDYGVSDWTSLLVFKGGIRWYIDTFVFATFEGGVTSRTVGPLRENTGEGTISLGLKL